MCPMVYTSAPGATLATSAATNTAADHFRLVTGAALTTSGTGQSRNVNVQAVYVTGRGAGLTQISGITYRIQRWTTTTSTSGTAITPAPGDPGFQAATAGAQYAASGVSLVQGTGGPTLLKAIGSGATGPGGWVAPNPDSLLTIVANNTTNSIDLWSHCGTASIPFEFSVEHGE
jgi:hypothetical protein